MDSIKEYERDERWTSEGYKGGNLDDTDFLGLLGGWLFIFHQRRDYLTAI